MPPASSASLSAPRAGSRLDRLVARLPGRAGSAIRWLLKPSSRWARIPAGLLLILGSVLSILPVFGLWMLPAGLLLLAEDVTSLRRLRERGLAWLEGRRPEWFAASS